MAGRTGDAELNAYIAEQVDERRRNPSDDLIGKMVAAPFAQIDEEKEIIASNTQLVFAGNETTAKLMAHTLVSLAAHPDQRAPLAADRALVPAAIEEVHRWQTLTQSVTARRRRVGSPGSASPPGRWSSRYREREPRSGPLGNASDFDITRPPRQHLGFGFGLHGCIGLNLARLEAQVWLNRLLDLLPDFEWPGRWTTGPTTSCVARRRCISPLDCIPIVITNFAH